MILARDELMLRRPFLQGLGILPAFAVLPSTARATLVAGLTLEQLVTRSEHVVTLRAVDSGSSEATLGGKLCVVTDTRVEVTELLSGKEPSRLLTIRTLGGRIGNRGELVLGQPRLSLGSQDIAFLTKERGVARCWFVGMAQGHFPLQFGAAEPRLRRSSQLPEIRDSEGSAVKALDGLLLSAAKRSIQRAGAR